MEIPIWLPLLVLITHTAILVESNNFVLTVNFINYTNPTGLCAECETGLEAVTDASQLTPVCCDESSFRSDNCDNTGEARCDTRFRWTIRPFGASLETRPSPTPDADNPPYYFTNCDLSPTTCPFSEMSTTFSQGPTGFLGVAENPLSIITTAPWTGSVQFFIEAMDSEVPNIIDSLLVDLGNLRLGADFTEEMTFTGHHNISHMTMSFKVACQTGSCGRNCMTDRSTNLRIHTCHPNGDVVCNGRYDPSTICQSCLHNLDFSTDCSTCLEPNFDPDNSCSTCLKTNYDPVTNCTQCLPNRELSTKCTQCSPGWDISSDCMSCLPGRDLTTNCTQCLPNRELSTNCTQCSPGWDISSDCMSCLPGRDLTTNCTLCLPNRDLNTDCSLCLFGFDINSDCLVCLPGRDISTNCTTCEFGYSGESCVLDAATMMGVILASGVGSFLILIIIVLLVIISVLVYQLRRSCHAKFNVSERAVMNAYSLESSETGTETEFSLEHKFQNPIYGPLGELESNSEISEEYMYTNALYEASTFQREDNSSHSSSNLSAHQEKTKSSDIMSHAPDPVYDVITCQNLGSSKESPPVKTTVSLNNESQPSFSDEDNPQEKTSFTEIGDGTNLLGTDEMLYSVINESTGTHLMEADTSHQGPAEDYSELKHPAKTISKPAGPISGSNYSELHGNPAEDLPKYDVTSHAPLQTQPHALSPHQSALYDTADYPSEPSCQDDYHIAETSSLPSDSLHPGSTKPLRYDYVDIHVGTRRGVSSVLTTIDNEDKPAYTNTTPGKITAEAQSHYDFGQ